MAIGPDYSVRPYADKYARDETPVSESDLRSIQKMADNVDSKKWGIDTRYSISSSMRLMDEVIKDTVGRQDNVESQFQDVIDNTTDKDVISAPEIIAARDGEPNLKARLDKENQEVTAQLAHKTNQLVESFSDTKQSYSYPPKPIVVFTFDDGDVEDLTIMKPIFDEYGYNATSYVVPGLIGQSEVTSGINRVHMTVEQLQQLHNSGWEIASHTVNHKALALETESVAEYELKEAKKALNELGFKSNNFAYPYGSYNNLVEKLARKYYKTASMFNAYQNVNSLPINKTRLIRIALGSFFDGENDYYPITDTFNDYYKKFIDMAVAQNGLCIFGLHSWAMKDDIEQMGYLRDTLNYCRDNNIEVMNLDDALKYFDNNLDISVFNEDNTIKNYFRINSDGDLSTNMMQPTTLIDDNLYTNDTNASFYPIGKKSLMRVTSSAQGFPYRDGYVYTDKFFTHLDETRQWCYEKRRNGIKYRASKADGSWNDWREIATRKTPKLWFRPFSANTVIAAGTKQEVPITDFVTEHGDILIVNNTKPMAPGISFYAYNNPSNVATLVIQNTSTADITLTATNTEFNVSSILI